MSADLCRPMLDKSGKAAWTGADLHRRLVLLREVEEKQAPQKHRRRRWQITSFRLRCRLYKRVHVHLQSVSPYHYLLNSAAANGPCQASTVSPRFHLGFTSVAPTVAPTVSPVFYDTLVRFVEENKKYIDFQYFSLFLPMCRKYHKTQVKP